MPKKLPIQEYARRVAAVERGLEKGLNMSKALKEAKLAHTQWEYARDRVAGKTPGTAVVDYDRLAARRFTESTTPSKAPPSNSIAQQLRVMADRLERLSAVVKDL